MRGIDGWRGEEGGGREVTQKETEIEGDRTDRFRWHYTYIGSGEARRALCRARG